MLKNRQMPDAAYDLGWVVGVDCDAEIGRCVRRAAFGKKLFEAVAIGRERASGIVAQPLANCLERTIEPKRHARVAQQFTIYRLNKCSATEGDDCGEASFHTRRVLA